MGDSNYLNDDYVTRGTTRTKGFFDTLRQTSSLHYLYNVRTRAQVITLNITLMNKSIFSLIQLIQTEQMDFSRWEILDGCSSTKQMFGTIFNFELIGKWMLLYFDTNEEVLHLTNRNPLPQPSMVLRTKYGSETMIYFYPCDDDSSHFLTTNGEDE